MLCIACGSQTRAAQAYHDQNLKSSLWAILICPFCLTGMLANIHVYILIAVNIVFLLSNVSQILDVAFFAPQYTSDALVLLNPPFFFISFLFVIWTNLYQFRRRCFSYVDNNEYLSLSVTSDTVNPEIFARILFSRIASKDIFATLKSRLGHDLPRSVNDKVISPFREDFIFTKLRICKVSRKKTLAKISGFTVTTLYNNMVLLIQYPSHYGTQVPLTMCKFIVIIYTLLACWKHINSPRLP